MNLVFVSGFGLIINYYLLSISQYLFSLFSLVFRHPDPSFHDSADEQNLFFHINHVLVPPAVDAIMADGQAKINAFIGPAHVSVISGAKIYLSLPKKYGTPVAVSGFEPVDVMESILMIIRQKNENRSQMEIQYSRSVTLEGNTKAQDQPTYKELHSGYEHGSYTIE